MAVFTFNRMALLVTDYVMGASASIVPPASWTVGLASTPTSGYVKNTSVWSATVSGANVNEIGTTTANGYARQTINRDQTTSGWQASTTDATGATTVGKGGGAPTGVTFGTFTSTGPSPNGANSWVVTDGATLNAGQLYFAGDTAATRTFSNGDTERVTPSLKAA